MVGRPEHPDGHAAPIHDPRLVGRWVTLTAIKPNDLPFLYDLALDPMVSGGLSLGGAVPPFEHFQRTAYESAFAQWVVRRRVDGSRCGLVVLASADFRNGTAFVSVVMSSTVVGRGLGLDALATGVGYVFDAFPFRNLYMEMTAPNLARLHHAVAEFAETEGVRREAVFQDGRYHDLYMLAIRRSTWATVGRSAYEDLRDATPASVPMASESLEQFLDAFSHEFAGDGIAVRPESRLWEDLDFDSLEMMRLLVWMEERYGSSALLDDPPVLATVGDAHRLTMT